MLNIFYLVLVRVVDDEVVGGPDCIRRFEGQHARTNFLIGASRDTKKMRQRTDKRTNERTDKRTGIADDYSGRSSRLEVEGVARRLAVVALDALYDRGSTFPLKVF